MDPQQLSALAAVGWLSLLVACCLGYLWLQIGRSPYSMWENVLYTPTYLFGRLLWRVEFTNAPPAEILGGAVLVANHRSSVDPFFVQLSAKRRVHWMVAREYCDHFLFGPLLKALLVIPTNRSGMDTGATKHAIRLAKEGRLVGMFPEGRLNHTSDPLVSIRSGAALVAMRAGVPMIPLFISGSPYRREVWSPLAMTAHVRITFGQPIAPPSTVHTDPATNSSQQDAHDVSQVEGRTNDSSRTDENASSSDDSRRANDSAATNSMMLNWGKQIVEMAGRPDWNIQLSGRNRHKS